MDVDDSTEISTPGGCFLSSKCEMATMQDISENVSKDFMSLG